MYLFNHPILDNCCQRTISPKYNIDINYGGAWNKQFQALSQQLPVHNLSMVQRGSFSGALNEELVQTATTLDNALLYDIADTLFEETL